MANVEQIKVLPPLAELPTHVDGKLNWDAVAKARQVLGDKKVDFAEEISCGLNSVYRWEAGETEPRSVYEKQIVKYVERARRAEAAGKSKAVEVEQEAVAASS